MSRPYPSAYAARPSPLLEGRGALLPRQGRGAVGVKTFDRLQAPSLALLALGFGPDDRLPVRRQDEPGAGVGDFHAIAAGFVDVEKERLLDRVLVRPGLDEDPVFEKNVCRAQNFLAAVEREGHVMEAAPHPVRLQRIGEVVTLVGA